MSAIVPTIMVETLDQLRATIERIQPFAQRVHVDISDGEFAPTFLLGEAQLYWPKEWRVDIHAMVMRPSEHMAQLLALKPNLVILHAEASENIIEHFAQLKQAGIRVGIGLLQKTVPASVAGAIKAADHVMIFSGQLGQYGGTASMMQLEKVRLVKALNPNAEIGWDGGVGIDNAYTLARGGVDVLNVGGALANAEDPRGVYEQLVGEINKHGVI